jgi:hypothetical protein
VVSRPAVPRLEGQVEHLADVADGVHRQLLPDILRHVLQIGLVALRDQHRGDAGPVRREQLLLHPADRQDPPGQRDLAGHRHIGAHQPPGEQGRQRGGHGDPGARPVLGHRTRRHVHVHAPVLQVADWQFQLGAV